MRQKFFSSSLRIITYFQILIFSNCLFLKQVANCQTLSPSVLPSAGGYYSASNGSLSWTLGETVIPTLTAGGNMLTQGFQQPYKMTLNLKAFIQGYYKGGGLMENVLFTQGVINVPNTQCDTIQIELRQNSAPYSLVSSSNQVINTDGTVTFSGSGNIGQSYYIVIKHRNAIETWSANPITISEITNYDFTTASNKAFGSNQSEVASGLWALYSGDFNHDENIDLLDLGNLEADISSFQFGYFATDINGDGNVDLLDAAPVEENVNGFVYAIHP